MYVLANASFHADTSRFDAPANDAQLQTGRQVVTSIKSILESCPTDHYQIVSQPNAAAADIRTASGCGVPNLCKAVEDSRVKGTFSVAEVVGQIDRHELEEYIQAVCAKKGKTVTVSETKLPALSTKDHAAQLADNGTWLLALNNCWESWTNVFQTISLAVPSRRPSPPSLTASST
jgi:hypothetical protein